MTQKKQRFGGKPAYTYKVTPLYVHDGDTFVGRIDLNLPARGKDRDLGFHLKVIGGRTVWEWWIRLTGINANELANPGGPEAKAHLETLVMGQSLSMHSHLVKIGELDLYERVLGQCFVLDPNGIEGGVSISDAMINDGYAAAWDGHGPKPTIVWPPTGA